MTYEVEVINWEWQITRNNYRGDCDHCWFSHAGNNHPRIKKFRSMKAARAWLEENGFKPVFRAAKRPCMYISPMGGMEARIVLKGDEFGFYPNGSSESHWARLS